MVDTNYTLSADGQEKDLSRYNSPQGVVLRWIKELDLVLNSEKQRIFEHTGEKIVKDYKNAESHRGFGNMAPDSERVMYNVLWANVEVLYPMLFARMPNVVCERWYKDSDPIGRQAAEIAECCTQFQLKTQQDRFIYAVGSAVKDMLLVGRGQVWIRYDVEFENQKDANGNTLTDDEGEPIKQAKPNSEKVVFDPLMWQDYIESMARNQYEVRWRAKRAYMTREELELRFGEEIGKKVPLQSFKEGADKREKLDDDEQFLMQAEVWEILDEKRMQTIWISRGYKDGPLDTKDNPLNLSDFYCCPIPLLATTTSDSTYPTPDYVIYERLASEVDWATKRISSIFECIRVVGATAAQYNAEIKEMLKLADGQLWPVKNWAGWMAEGKGGLANIIDWMPFDQAVAAIEPMRNYRDDCLQKIDGITGVPDFAHGNTDPNETAMSVQKRSHWTQPKIKIRQADVQRFCREGARKTAEIIFEPGLFSDETIALMYGLPQRPPQDQQTFPQALALLRNDRMRTFEVDIETDSTISTDEEENQEQWMKYMESVQGILGQVQNISQFRPELMHPALESCLGAIRSLRTGRQVEGAWEKAMKDIEDNDLAAKNNPQPPPPDPSIQIAQMRSQDEQAKLAWDQQKAEYDWGKQDQESQEKTQEFWANYDLQKAKNDADYEINMEKVNVEGSRWQDKASHDAMMAELEQFKVNFTAAIESKLVDLKKLETSAKIAQGASQETRLATQAVLDLHHQAHEHTMDKANLAHTQVVDSMDSHHNAATVMHDNMAAVTDQMKAKNDAKMVGMPKVNK